MKKFLFLILFLIQSIFTSLINQKIPDDNKKRNLYWPAEDLLRKDSVQELKTIDKNNKANPHQKNNFFYQNQIVITKALEEKSREYKNQLAETINALKASEAKYNDYEIWTDKNLSILEQKNKMLKTLEKENTLLTTKLESSQKTMEELKAIQEKMKTINNQYQFMLTINDSQSKQIASLSIANQNQLKKIEELNSNIADKDEIIKKQQQQNNEILEARLKEIDATNNQRIAEIEKIKKELDQYNKKVNSNTEILEARLKEIDAINNQRIAENEKLKKELDQYKKVNSNIEKTKYQIVKKILGLIIMPILFILIVAFSTHMAHVHYKTIAQTFRVFKNFLSYQKELFVLKFLS